MEEGIGGETGRRELCEENLAQFENLDAWNGGEDLHTRVLEKIIFDLVLKMTS